ncbi:hypothetical protein [uncultured Acinetobacter sp.]|uniref:hypothetical protein n=1 Tax=uncultured Acinetobacter sp. TaxID=165433 RepID=UPI00258EACAB|nr:hypothetical protein [uncultured Acinetobacter sp.]
MIDIQYGILKEIPVPEKYGVIACIANVTITQPDGHKEDDAALIFSRKSYGFGRSHLILRQNMHGVLETEVLIKMATHACMCLFGSFMPDVTHRLADLILDHTDDLVLHPPEDVLIEEKKREKEIERMGLHLVLNDTTLVDAR